MFFAKIKKTKYSVTLLRSAALLFHSNSLSEIHLCAIHKRSERLLLGGNNRDSPMFSLSVANTHFNELSCDADTNQLIT